jgi:hypothetical protein
MDNSSPIDTQPLGLQPQSQSVLGSSVSPAQALADRLTALLVLDEISPCLRHFCQGLGDVVGGHALCFEIQITPSSSSPQKMPSMK